MGTSRAVEDPDVAAVMLGGLGNQPPGDNEGELVAPADSAILPTGHPGPVSQHARANIRISILIGNRCRLICLLVKWGSFHPLKRCFICYFLVNLFITNEMWNMCNISY